MAGSTSAVLARARGWRRAAAAVAGAIAIASGAVVVMPVLGADAGTTAPATTDRAQAAAGWLARNLVGTHHDHYVFAGTTYVDYGMTADAALSMDAAGSSQDAVRRMTSYLAAHVNDYAPGSPTDSPGQAAKLILVAVAQHRNPHDFGGHDLVKALRGSEGADGAASGEYHATYPSVINQALAVLALSIGPRTAPPSAAAVNFLSNQQCDDGGFMQDLRNGGTCTGEIVDATAYAAQALLAAGAKAPALRAITWLEHHQHANGSFGSPANSNSTGLAAQALMAAHARLHGAVTWLTSKQVGCSGRTARRGAITFSGSYDDRALRATAQATGALARTPLAWTDNGGARLADLRLAC